MNDKQYQVLNEGLNYCIGRITIPMMKYRRDEDIKAVHEKLLEIAHNLDEMLDESV